jgi:hypothetical protein
VGVAGDPARDRQLRREDAEAVNPNTRRGNRVAGDHEATKNTKKQVSVASTNANAASDAVTSAYPDHPTAAFESSYRSGVGALPGGGSDERYGASAGTRRDSPYTVARRKT